MAQGRSSQGFGGESRQSYHIRVEESDRHLVTKAFELALEIHAGQTRKGTAIPYSSHLLQVAGLVQEAGGDAAQTAAALLHDSLEDSDDVDAATLGEQLGAEVVELVVACSDLLPGDTPDRKSPWTERKTRYLEHLAASGSRARLVSCCDKLHNLRSLAADLRAEGRETLERFNAGPRQQRWYFESLHPIAVDTLPIRLALEYEAALAVLVEFVPEPGSPD
jgi:(p)ppGpp synthase/HD superfamily hydrolase